MHVLENGTLVHLALRDFSVDRVTYINQTVSVCFHPEYVHIDVWEPIVRSLSVVGLGVAVVGRHMYAVGGISCALSQKTVQKYDPETDKWSQLEDMDCSRSSFAIGAL